MSVSFQVPIFTRDDLLAAQTGVAWGQFQHPIVLNHSNDCRNTFRRDLIDLFVYQDHQVPIGSSTFIDVDHHVLFPEKAKLVTFMDASAWNPLSCVACEAGKYNQWRARPANSVLNGSSACKLCEPGKYAPGTGEKSALTCTACPNNTYTHSGHGSINITNCTCNIGYSAGRAGEECFPCDVGKFKPLNGSHLCGKCAVGTYMPLTASTACTICPPNSSSIEGSALLTDCTCNAGYYMEAEVCKECPQGAFLSLLLLRIPFMIC